MKDSFFYPEFNGAALVAFSSVLHALVLVDVC